MKILIGAPVRQDAETFKYYLESLDKLKVPKGATVDRFFIVHNSPELCPVMKDPYLLWESAESYVTDEVTHRWTNSLISEVAAMRNYLLKYAWRGGYHYYFMVDSDLILHPETLRNLIKQGKDLIAELFWTRWQPEGDPLPNAWDYDNYIFNSADRLLQFSKPGVYKVGMTGACILMSNNVLKSKVSYDPVPNLSLWGEDRAFCVRAACEGFDIWLDTNYPARHLYRKSDLEAYLKEKGEV